MPPEVLHEIFQESNCTSYISTQLAPFARAQLYKEIELTSLSQLNLFFRTFHDQVMGREDQEDSLGSLIQSLSIAISINDPQQILLDENHKANLIYLFMGCTSLKSLTIKHHLPAIIALLSPGIKIGLPSLQVLVLDWPNAPYSVAINPASYSMLSSYPKLQELTVFFGKDVRERMEGVKIQVHEPVKSNSKIISLVFTAVNQDAMLYCQDFLEFFQNLHVLAIFQRAQTTSNSFRPSHNLSKVDVTQIRWLSLSFAGGKVVQITPVRDPLELIINKFTSLAILHIDRGTYTSALFPLLKNVPLKLFTIRDYSDVSYQDLAGLLKGPHKVSTLESLTLEAVEPLEEPLNLQTCNDMDFFFEHLEGILPEWPPNLSYDDAFKLTSMAKEVGVTLDGDIRQACISQFMYDGILKMQRQW